MGFVRKSKFAVGQGSDTYRTCKGFLSHLYVSLFGSRLGNSQFHALVPDYEYFLFMCIRTLSDQHELRLRDGVTLFYYFECYELMQSITDSCLCCRC